MEFAKGVPGISSLISSMLEEMGSSGQSDIIVRSESEKLSGLGSLYSGLSGDSFNWGRISEEIVFVVLVPRITSISPVVMTALSSSFFIPQLDFCGAFFDKLKHL